AFDVFLRSVAPEARADGVTTTSIYMPLVHTRMSAPTPAFSTMPALRPDQAPDRICQAIVERPATIAPWWLPVAESAATVVGGPLDAVTSAYYRATADTRSA